MSIKKDNKFINKLNKTALFSFNIDKSSLNLTGKIYIFKECTIPDWLKEINLVSKKKINFMNFKYKCLILIKIHNNTFAISYNNGDILLKNNYIDKRFGYRLSRNILQNNKLKNLQLFYPVNNIPVKNLTTTYGDYNIPYYNQFNDDDIFMVDLVKGKAKLGNYKDITLSGTDSIKMSGKLFLNKDLIFILNILNDKLNSDLTENHFDNEINKITDNVKIRELNNYLQRKLSSLEKQFDKNKYLNSGSLSNIGFVDINYDSGKFYTISSVNIDNKKKFQNISGIERWERIISTLNMQKYNIGLLDYIKRLTVKTFNYEGEILNKNKLIYFLSFYKKVNNNYYLFREGNWYSIDISLTNKIINSVNDIERFHDNEKLFFMYSRSRYAGENSYNKKVFENNKDKLYLFDKKLYKPNVDFQHYNSRGSIEICDLLEVKENFINLFCIKAATHSSGFSHLIGQAYAVAKYISYIDNHSLEEHIKDIIHDDIDLKSKNINIILGLITPKNINKDSLNSDIFPILPMIELQILKNFCNKNFINLKILFIKSN